MEQCSMEQMVHHISLSVSCRPARGEDLRQREEVTMKWTPHTPYMERVVTLHHIMEDPWDH